jgi:nitroreductase/SAM-dependent methyltransferase
MELSEAIKNRRSVRVFSEDDVDNGKIEKVLDAAQWAPSACNKQAWEFIVVRDAKTKERLVGEANAAAFLKKAPVAIYVLYRSDITTEYKANIQSGAAAVQNMLLEAYSIGLGSVWVCRCGERGAVRKILGIPDNHDVLCAVLLGYAKETPKPPKRKDVREIMHLGKFREKKSYRTIFPEDWDPRALMQYRENGIRANSPTPGSFPPPFMKEFEKEVEIFSGFARNSKRTLDVLSFSGNYLLEIAKKAQIKQVDVFETSKQIADFILKKQRNMGIGCKISFGLSDILKIPYKPNTFDLVMCIKKLEMLPDPQILVREMVRVLKPGGRLVLSFWNSRSIYGINYKIKTGSKRDTRIASNEGPVRPMGIKRVKKMLISNGLKINDTKGINLFPKKFQSHTTGGPIKNICRTVVLSCTKAR